MKVVITLILMYLLLFTAGFIAGVIIESNKEVVDSSPEIVYVYRNECSRLSYDPLYVVHGMEGLI